MNEWWKRALGGLGVWGRRGGLWGAAMTLLLSSLWGSVVSAGRVSESEFARLAISFDLYSTQKTGGLIAKDAAWAAYSSQFKERTGEQTCKPVSTSNGEVWLQVPVYVSTPKLDDPIVPFSGDQVNRDTIAHLESLLLPMLIRHCPGAGEGLALNVYFMFADVISPGAVLSYHLAVTGGRLVPKNKAGVSVNLGWDERPVSKTKRGFIKAQSSDSFYFRLLGEELPDALPPVIAGVPSATAPAVDGGREACRKTVRSRLIRCVASFDLFCSAGAYCKLAVNCDSRKEPQRYMYCQNKITAVASDRGIYFCDPEDTWNFDADVEAVLKEACK